MLGQTLPTDVGLTRSDFALFCLQNFSEFFRTNFHSETG